MSWRWESATVKWTKRADITVDNSAGTTAAHNVTVTIPAQWDDFWDTIDASGNELRVTDSDGQAAKVWDLSGFNKTNRTGTIRIESVSMTASTMQRLCLYWGSVGTAGSASGAPATGSPKTGYLGLDMKRRVLVAIPEDAGATIPRLSISKGTADELDVVIDYGALMSARLAPHAGRLLAEEIDRITLQVLDSSAVDQTAMYDLSKCRFIGTSTQSFVSLRIKAGTNAANYTAVLSMTTTGTGSANTILFRFGVQVNNVVQG